MLRTASSNTSQNRGAGNPQCSKSLHSTRTKQARKQADTSTQALGCSEAASSNTSQNRGAGNPQRSESRHSTLHIAGKHTRARTPHTHTHTHTHECSELPAPTQVRTEGQETPNAASLFTAHEQSKQESKRTQARRHLGAQKLPAPTQSEQRGRKPPSAACLFTAHDTKQASKRDARPLKQSLGCSEAASSNTSQNRGAGNPPRSEFRHSRQRNCTTAHQDVILLNSHFV
ncbi:hypothetical protein COO60DRAFT_866809 [Scenedesmus sp. NREL 46B-D3]|nr:hypothetical protein COO60DRAFT_866809 [Scenedesmus sp. NREL 46B-D3]